jgi:hypothetical protein
MAFDTQTKTDVAEQLQAVFLEYSLFLEGIDEKKLFEKVSGKWNIAQQTDHLTIANTVTAIGFNTPKVAIKTLFGLSNRNSYSYDEVVFRYQSKLTAGAKASFAFQPKLSLFPNKKLLITLWNRSVDGLLKAVNAWNEDDLDSYQLSHPILGKITMHEMLHFTIYHVRHHLKLMQLLSL